MRSILRKASYPAPARTTLAAALALTVATFARMA